MRHETGLGSGAELQRHVRCGRPTTSRDLKPGLARVQGRARGSELLAAPITGQAVIGYQLVFELELLDGRRQVVSIARVAPFDVEDEFGRVPVDTSRGAALVLQHEFSADSAAVGSAAAPVQALLVESLDHATLQSLSGHFSWHTFYLQQGEPALVCGQLAGGFEDRARRERHYRDNSYALGLVRPTGGQLVISDMDLASLLQRLAGAPI